MGCRATCEGNQVEIVTQLRGVGAEADALLTGICTQYNALHKHFLL